MVLKEFYSVRRCSCHSTGHPTPMKGVLYCIITFFRRFLYILVTCIGTSEIRDLVCRAGAGRSRGPIANLAYKGV